MSIEEMLESDDWEIFELGLKLKEERDGIISIVERLNYSRKLLDKYWIKMSEKYKKQFNKFVESELSITVKDYKNESK